MTHILILIQKLLFTPGLIHQHPQTDLLLFQTFRQAFLIDCSHISPLYLLYIRMSGFQISVGGILMSLTEPYSVSFQMRLLSCHS